jgi:hypothetical protein
MSVIGVLIGSESSKFTHGGEDPASVLRFSVLAATWVASNGHTVLALGDGPALLTVGTAVIGLQQGRVVEGGERRASPVRVLAQLATDNPERDRALSFQRRSREFAGDSARFEDGQEVPFGDLSFLVDLGLIDVVGELALQPQSPDIVAQNLPTQLLDQRPDAILVLGEIPGGIDEAVLRYVRETGSLFASILGDAEGAERLAAPEQEPMLENRRLRFRRRESAIDDVDSEAYYTSDEELMRAGREATWEAEMTFRLYNWLSSIPK